MTTIAAMPVSAGRSISAASARCWSMPAEVGTVLKLLHDLTEAEIGAKLPVHLRRLSDVIAA